MIYNDNVASIIDKLINNENGIDLMDFSDDCLCAAISTANMMIDEKIVLKNEHSNKFNLTKDFSEWFKSNNINNINKFKEYYFNIERLFQI